MILIRSLQLAQARARVTAYDVQLGAFTLEEGDMLALTGFGGEALKRAGVVV